MIENPSQATAAHAIELAPLDIRAITGIVGFALLAALMSLVVGQLPQQPVGSQHDSLHTVWFFQDSTLYPADKFAPPWREQPTVFWRLLSFLIPKESGAIVLLTWGSVGANFSFFIGVGFLATVFSRHRGAPYVSIALLGGLGDPLLGANYLLVNHLIPVGVVAGPLLIALVFVFKRRFILGFGLIGLAANVHFLQAFYVGTLAFSIAIGLLLIHTSHFVQVIRQLGLPLVVGFLASLPVISWMIPGLGGSPPDGWADVIREGHHIHYFALSQSMPTLVKTTSLVLIMFSVTIAEWEFNRPVSRAIVGASVAWIGGFVLLGSYLTDVAAWAPAILFQPLRATSWMIPLVVCAGVGISLRKTAMPAVRIFLIAALLGMGILQFMRPTSGALGNLLPFYVLGCSALALLCHIRRFPPLLTYGMAPMAFTPLLLIVFYLMGGSWPVLDFVFDLYFPLVLVALAIIGGLVCRERIVETCTRPAMFIGASLAMNVLILILVLMVRVQRNQPIIFQPKDTPWLEACLFLRENAPTDSLVQGHPQMSGLRTLTRRSVFFEQNDDGVLYVDANALPWLQERADLLRVPLIKTYGPAAPWPAASVPWSELASVHGVTHAVVPVTLRVEGRVVFENAVWHVVELRQEAN